MPNTKQDISSLSSYSFSYKSYNAIFLIHPQFFHLQTLYIKPIIPNIRFLYYENYHFRGYIT